MSEYGEYDRPNMDDLIRMMDQWPVLIRALNRKGILLAGDRNALRFATRDRIDKRTTFAKQLELALEETPAQADEKRKSPDRS